MAAPIAFSQIDDKDLDDAALWAVIDSATATASRSLSISKPLNSPSPSKAAAGDGEVEHEPWPFRPPRKVPRICSSPLPLVKNGHRTPPEAHLSPQIGRQSISPYAQLSPGPGLRDRSRSEEKEIALPAFSPKFPSVSLFKDYQNTAMAILEKTDYTLISGRPFIKKSGWRKISCFFNISFEIRDKSIEFDESRNVQRAEFVVRAYMQGGRFSDGWGSCERREKRFQKPNHDVPSTAETRAKNKACQDLLGIGEYRSGDMAGSVVC